MIKIEYINIDSDLEDTEGNKIVIENSNDVRIEDVISIFTKLSKAIGFNEHIIIKALLEEADDIKESIKENYLMSLDESQSTEI